MARSHPLRDSKAKTCAQALIRHWISRFGLPEDITSDRSAQFTSSLWTELGQVFGVQLHTTTAYNPQANDMIERLHHQLNSSLKARITDPYWIDHLPLVLLGIYVTWREEPGCSPGELVYGSGLRLSGEFVDHHNPRNTQPPEDFLRHLQCAMHTLLPTPAIHHSKPLSYIPPTLMQSKFVYVRVDSHKKPLQRPYDGPFRVISTSDKLFVLDINGRQEKVSVDLFMPTFIENRSPISVSTSSTMDPEATLPIPTDHRSNDETPSMTTIHHTRSGRQRRFPRHLNTNYVYAMT